MSEKPYPMPDWARTSHNLALFIGTIILLHWFTLPLPFVMKAIKCSGNSLEIGLQHGKAAKTEISRGLVFYGDLFKKVSI